MERLTKEEHGVIDSTYPITVHNLSHAEGGYWIATAGQRPAATVPVEVKKFKDPKGQYYLLFLHPVTRTVFFCRDAKLIQLIVSVGNRTWFAQRWQSPASTISFFLNPEEAGERTHDFTFYEWRSETDIHEEDIYNF